MQVEETSDEETGEDLLILCAGDCGKKILNFGLSGKIGSLCIDCLTSPLKIKPEGKEDEIGKNITR